MHNPVLADKQGLNSTERETIDKLHLLRGCLEREAEDSTNSSERINHIYNIWIGNEILLQKIWKFDNVHTNFIKFWNFPRCSCPKNENNLLYPNGEYHTDSNCLIHGIKE